jgi:glycosyltransferase involved in cell wall biosynthesis
MSLKILFHENSLSERGTSTAVYDYVYYAREYLDVEPVVCYDTRYPNNISVVEKFQKEFEVIGYNDFSEVQQLADQRMPDYFYAIKYGVPDGVQIRNSKNLIHSVFARNPENQHGDIYAVVSEWQSQQSGGVIPFVPHMLNLPDHREDFRAELGIPKDALVVGRYGAYDTFNIQFAVDTVNKILNKRRDIWFIFLNTEKKIDHERCLYLPAITDPVEKVRYLNTCDAMLHARDYGETFGLSVLEFAAQGKQIISYDDEELQTRHPLGGRNHFLFLKDNCFKYQNADQLGYLLMHLTRKNPFDTAYLREEYSPKNIMSIFQKVFLS